MPGSPLTAVCRRGPLQCGRSADGCASVTSFGSLHARISTRIRNARRYIAGDLILVAQTMLPSGASYACTSVCNQYCDGRDPALSAGDRQPVSAPIYSRSVVLHLDDAHAMALGRWEPE